MLADERARVARKSGVKNKVGKKKAVRKAEETQLNRGRQEKTEFSEEKLKSVQKKPISRTEEPQKNR